MDEVEIFGKPYNVKQIGKTFVLDPEVYVDRKGKPININVQRRLIDKLNHHMGGEGLPASSRWQLGDVINAFWILKSKQKLSNPQIQQALPADEFSVSKYVGLAEKLKGEVGESAGDIDRAKGYDKKYEEFLKDPIVIQYRKDLDQRAATKEKLKEYTQSPPKVHEVLTRLNLSPSAFLFEGTNMGGAEKLRKIKETLKPERDFVLERSRKKAEAKGEKSKGTAWYSYAKALRSFIKFSGISVPDQPADSVLAQSVKEFEGKYADLKATPKEVQLIKECLMDAEGFEKVKNEILSRKEFKGKKITMSHKDAYFMFLLSLQIGFRANEALTISTRVFSDDRESGIKPKIWRGKTSYQIQILTRKSAWVGQYTHKVLILDDECNKLIAERLQQVKDGIGIIAEKNRVGKLQDHSLIGFDDQYVQVNTLQNPKPKVTTQQNLNQLALKDFFRSCYEFAGLIEPYYTKKPFHSMRHIFAQYWLNKTSYDYQFVADLGHWKTLSVLKKSYGAPDDDVFYAKQAIYHSREHKDMTQEANQKISAEEFDALRDTYKSDIDALHAEDKKKEIANMKKMEDKQ